MFADFNGYYPKLYTERLVLRAPKPSDVEDVYKICSDPYSCRYADWQPHNSKKETKDYISWLKRGARRDFKGSYTWFAELKSTKEVIATISITETDRSGFIATIGYTLSKAHQHQGFAFEAVSTLISYLFRERMVKRVEAKVMVENTPSINLLRRLGFKNEGLIRKGAFCKTDCVDIYLFGLTVDDYKG